MGYGHLVLLEEDLEDTVFYWCFLATAMLPRVWATEEL
jgi:hypothetical protein